MQQHNTICYLSDAYLLKLICTQLFEPFATGVLQSFRMERGRSDAITNTTFPKRTKQKCRTARTPPPVACYTLLAARSRADRRPTRLRTPTPSRAASTDLKAPRSTPRAATRRYPRAPATARRATQSRSGSQTRSARRRANRRERAQSRWAERRRRTRGF
ncbi:hypothetical protein PLICRDRAFT_182999 [Plicaturopsis crispa FD-325 SS-3]|nr:hypothetical protein PLICRDRAFT_182999 [Plicaturopsis crispa FD-325 SS-3]